MKELYIWTWQVIYSIQLILTSLHPFCSWQSGKVKDTAALLRPLLALIDQCPHVFHQRVSCYIVEFSSSLIFQALFFLFGLKQHSGKFSLGHGNSYWLKIFSKLYSTPAIVSNKTMCWKLFQMITLIHNRNHVFNIKLIWYRQVEIKQRVNDPLKSHRYKWKFEVLHSGAMQTTFYYDYIRFYCSSTK